MHPRRNVSLAELTTLGVGGQAKFLVEAKSMGETEEAIAWAKAKKLDWMVIGEGSNLLVSDSGYTGLVIVNQIDFIERKSPYLAVGAGTNLNRLVDYANSAGLAGMECLAGIPGSVGGAVYGNAGAYGQIVSDHLVKVATLRRIRLKSDCRFEYRESAFKANGEVIVAVEFQLPAGYAAALAAKSAEIRRLRQKKYPPGLKCPGSFFKNLLVKNLPARVKRMIPSDKVREGKIPAGYLLEQVGAKGMKLGGARVADHHGNLIYNAGGATANQIWRLAQSLQVKVRTKFGIVLEPEVQLMGFDKS